MLGNLLFELIISQKQRHTVEADVSVLSHLDPVPVLGGGGGDLLAHAGPGQHQP